jgi:hypothetical protein
MQEGWETGQFMEKPLRRSDLNCGVEEINMEDSVRRLGLF